MTTSTIHAGFARRFDRLWTRVRCVLLGRAVCWAAAFMIVGVAVLAAADYYFEIARSLRVILLAGVGLAALGLLCASIARIVSRCSRPQTAAEIERRFPQLGQSVRTTVQYSGRDEADVQSDGVAPSLVAALDEETDLRSYPLGIERIVPRIKTAALAAGGALILLAGMSAVDWQWRLATGRALLFDRPYTEMTVTPGDMEVEEGAQPHVGVQLKGRTDRQVVLLTRPADEADAEWSRRELVPEDRTRSEARLSEYEVWLDPVSRPLEYRVAAGPAQSNVHRIDVHYPLRLDRIEVDVTPPEYTRLEPTTEVGGDLSVIDGTTAAFHVYLDRKPSSARAVFTEHGADEAGPRVETVPLEIDGSVLTFRRKLTADASYSIFAEAADGTQIPENSFRIRVRTDKPPQVWFEEPGEAVEVHSLAEVLLRIRARDDFGLTKAGIVFEVNNEEEYHLLSKDFTQAAEELKDKGRLLPTTAAALERVFPLEYFQLTQKDSVTYYAYAEDNYPGGARRRETDLRFIDIRPFRRLYRLLEGMPEMGAGNDLVSLDELIARQRYALNRTLRIAKQAERGDEVKLGTVEQLIEFETDVARGARELAEFLLDRDVPGNDSIFRAEEFMLSAIDSLAVGKYATSALQQKDALRYLVDGRNKIEIALSDQPLDVLRQIRSFSRMQAQKLRRPDNEDEDDPQRIVERLQELAEDQDFVYETLAGVLMKGASDSEPMNDEPEPEEADPEADASGSPDDPEADASGSPAGGMSREEVAQKQTDISLEAHDVERILSSMGDVSDLARSRITEAAALADGVAGALDRGDSEKAAEDARRASRMFGELARHVDALLQPEAVRQIARSRDMAGGLAQLQRRAAERLGQAGNNKPTGNGDARREQGDPAEPSQSAGPSAEDNAEAPSEQLAGLAERGKTLLDVLRATSESTDLEGQEGVWQVGELLEEQDVEETVERMQRLPQLARQGDMQEAAGEAESIGERMQVLGQELARIYRRTVTPRLQELTDLRQQAAELQDQLGELETQAAISMWHRRAEEFLQRLEEQRAAGPSGEELRRVMREAGWGTNARWDWTVDGAGYYTAPDGYAPALEQIVEELEQRAQELILAERIAGEDEATPPEYEHLVEEYYRTLSSGKE